MPEPSAQTTPEDSSGRWHQPSWWGEGLPSHSLQAGQEDQGGSLETPAEHRPGRWQGSEKAWRGACPIEARAAAEGLAGEGTTSFKPGTSLSPAPGPVCYLGAKPHAAWRDRQGCGGVRPSRSQVADGSPYLCQAVGVLQQLLH